MDDPLGVQDPHGGCNLMQKDSDGVFTESAFSWEKRRSINIQVSSAHSEENTEGVRNWDSHFLTVFTLTI